MTTSASTRTTTRVASRPASESVAKKDVQKLQRAIVDGLEDVKAQDIVVFNTEALSSLFERVIIASGTSNRQTKALAASVRDAVREAGFPKPRIEGEENGEWIIVDCGAAVAHIMQPTIRQYYHLEEIWGQTPVRLKFGAVKPAVVVEEPQPVVKKSAAAKKAAADGPSLRRSSAVKTAERDAKQAAERAEREAKPPARKRGAYVRSAPAKTGAAGKVAKSSSKLSPTSTPTKVIVKAPAKKLAAKKAAPAVAVKSTAKAPTRTPAKKTSR